MWIVKLDALSNGAHQNHSADHITSVPDGWAMIPEEFTVPDTFPFVDIEAEEMTHTREVEVEKPVTKTREYEGEDGETITETYTEMETVIETLEYTMMTVTAMTPGVEPEPVPEPEPEPTEEQLRLDALEEQLADTDEVAIELFEATLEQEEINIAQDEALIEIYEMIGG